MIAEKALDLEDVPKENGDVLEDEQGVIITG